jgi:hypothetical protein
MKHLVDMRWHYQSGFESGAWLLVGVNHARRDQTDWLVAARSRGLRQRPGTQAGKTPAGGKGRGTAKSYRTDPYTMLDKIFKRDRVFDHIGMALVG